MPKEILLPALTADFEGGIIDAWHRQAGDKIEIGDIIAEVSTDKAVIELEAEFAGTLGKILVPAGADEVAVNTPIALMLLDGETQDALQGFVPGAELAADTAPTRMDPVGTNVEAANSALAEKPIEKGDRLFASPVAIRIANQLGINLASIEGSGPDGRIVLGDVEAVAALQGPKVAPTAAAASYQTTTEMPPAGSYTIVPADKIRTVIARRLSEAKRDIPHFYLTIDCVLDGLLEARRLANGSTGDDKKISVNDFIVKACAMALHDVPGANTGWANDSLLQFNDVNVAVAVATPRGLITPVVFRADTKDLSTISSELKVLATRAKEGRLKPEEYKGGGFTLSNLGMYGIREFSAIINPPQACILAVGAGEQRAVVRDGQVIVATVMSCTLSVDHHAVDGALGAEFLQAVKRYVERPELMRA
ncbi:MAG: pyruvate dehydrogenase complex dihydrolipoamide acetyltransferase [Woeseiaceae bacterium]|nr:pyruvate dehydrogenase complex dihydrolipoamide acetyltransferase [Woeseiaceae bacterium]